MGEKAQRDSFPSLASSRTLGLEKAKGLGPAGGHSGWS